MANNKEGGRWRAYLFTALLVAAAAVAVWYLWRHYFEDVWTRDARVRAVVVSVAPDVSGAIQSLKVVDNQYVEEGETLLLVDPRRYQLALDQARAEVAHRRQELNLLSREASRRRSLGRAISQEEREEADNKAALARADLQAAEAALARAELDLARSEVKAPVAGFVTHLLAHTGDYAQAGQPVVTLVDDQSFWVEAYLKETQVHQIRVGDAARIHLLGAGKALTGKVTGIGRGIANSNAVTADKGLPSVAPTFEWVRLAQRIPVRVEFDEIPETLLLSAGMTASVQVLPEKTRAR
ncbi:secretion protein HlyD family protein [Alcanivorax xiamenensis]|uniref:Secretion protein HlyD family protein n=1 Tax=Alcanivorax xiamenensis TaxID=1177156 RepID=A0ABQ6Y8B1_9GAMM|nr:efflux RND transporter periplasmic adaptor subunit [Alcanivorax xiamenensis]KAF0805509.1 secretion protein HlyD family protein [Alcanivorax xiamenensis]